MSFTTPWVLLLLLALPALVIIALSGFKITSRGWFPLPRGKGPGEHHFWPGQVQWREWVSLGLRGFIVTLLVLALAGMQRVQYNRNLTTLFLLDGSDSMGSAAQETGLAYVRQALAAMGPEDRAGLILFGADASVERVPSNDPTLGEPASVVNGSFTNIDRAVHLGLTLFPPDTTRRLVILSDGGANAGEARQSVQLAQAGGVEVSVVPLARPTGVEVQLDELRAPSTLHQGEQFDVNVTIHSTAPMSVPLQVFSEGQLVAQQSLLLQAGDNNFILPLVAGEPGFTTFQARLIPPADTFLQNNSLDAVSEVRGPLSIWVVAERPDEALPLATALRQAGLVVHESRPAELPSDLGSLSEASAVVLVNVPAPKLAPRQLLLLQSYVRDLGHGLVVIGGEESYGPGGYFQTPLEETLPVEMTIRDKQRLPGMTLLPIIDKSGSMADGGMPMGGGPRKVELAKEAVYRSVDLLVPYLDRLGVVTFDNAAQWVIEPTPVENTKRIKDAIGTIRASGGTDILAGLKLGAEAIVKEPSRVRHIILLSDGGADPGGIPELTRQLADQGVTLSVVAIGQGYAPFLEDVARIGRGRFYVADDASVIPQIFAQETSLANRSYIVEETFVPQPVSPSPILQGLNQLPPLKGYIATSSKLTAQVVLQGGQEQDPLLAQWQYGLGRAVAWTSDAKGQWAGDWVTWVDFPRFWTQVIRWTIVEGSSGALESQVRLEEDRAVVTAEVLKADGAFYNHLDMTLTIISPGLDPQAIPLEQVAPGLYEGRFQPGEVGTYLLHLAGQNGDTPVVAQTRGLVLTYSPEYRQTHLDATLLPDLAAIGRGRVLSLDAPADAFDHSLPPARSTTALWPWLLLAAILLWPFDVALRRVVLGREELRQAWARFQRSLPQRAGQPQGEPTSAGRLLQVKNKSRGEIHTEERPAVAVQPDSAHPSPIRPREAKPAVGAEAESPFGPPGSSEVEPTTIQRLKRAKQHRRETRK